MPNMGDDTPTLRAHCYSLLRSILTTAVHNKLISANPCHIKGAGNSKRVHKITTLDLTELAALVAAMPERLQPMTLFAAWCGLRFGELTELRRKDIDLTNGVIHVRRAVTRVGDQFVVGTPKSDAGIRDVSVPPHLLPLLRQHLSVKHHRRPPKACCSLPPETQPATSPPPASTGCSTRPARLQAGPTLGGTDHATQAPF